MPKHAKKLVRAADEHIGIRVRRRRLEIDVSQEALAKTLGVTFQQVQKYEKGTNRISGSRLQQLSEALKVPVAYFFDGLSNPGDDENQIINKTLATREGTMLIKHFIGITSPVIKKTAVRMVELLAYIDGMENHQ